MKLAPMNREQQAVVNALNHSGEHMFITGKAGTGKTHVLKWFRETTHKDIRVCAPTGVAALQAEGSTLHNLVGLKTTLPADMYQDFKLIGQKRAALDGVTAIVIDEVSMVSSAMLDAMDRNLRRIRHTPAEPFGGIQIIMFGDLYQLPPVVTDEDRAYYRTEGYDSPWFFDAHVWEESEFLTYALETIVRQSDVGFKDILNRVRDGTVKANDIIELNGVGGRIPPSDDKIMLLAAYRKMVAEHNDQQLRRLKGKTVLYKAKVNSGFGHSEPADREIPLRSGAKVMMLNNDLEDRWINGTLGKVTDLTDDTIYVDIDGSTHAVGIATWVKAGFPPEDYQLAPKFYQFPLRSAWAATIHKSQGLSLPEVQIGLGSAPKRPRTPGQVYVALSRLTEPSGLYLQNPLSLSDIRVDPHVKRFFEGV